MGTTDANGIYFYDDTDGAPTPSTLNLGQQSVSNALNGIRVTEVVANATERAALVASYVPTPSKPLYVHQQDLPAGRQFMVSTGGAFKVFKTEELGNTWVAISLYSNPGGIPPTIWTKLPDAIAPPAQMRNEGGWVSTRGLIRTNNGGNVGASTLIGSVPLASGLRPAYTYHKDVSTQTGRVVLSVDANGEIKMARNDGFTSASWLDLSGLTWPLG